MTHDAKCLQQRLSDYPLVARGKTSTAFKNNLTGFMSTLVQSISAKGLLFEEPALVENIQVWVITMSSAANRAFRHTSTVIALEIVSAFCNLGREFVDTRAKILRQVEGEQKNKKVNQSRVKTLQSAAQAAAERKAQLDSLIKDWFDTVFVHRYRDIDPKIRVDSVAYLSDWIWTYPEQFLDGQHLRYLGWVLSDTSALTRQEVAKRLQRIFKDDSKIAGLRQFTERFRPRMVEMATRDGEINVRCTSIALLDILRDKGLLEPDDIDTVGKLIFDVEPRIRKAVVPFFVASVEDSYQAKIEELDAEALQDFTSNIDEDGVEGPRLEWIRFKSLAELLQAYDTDEGTEEGLNEGPRTTDDFMPTSDSKTSLAAQAVFGDVPVLRKWEILAAFLVADHSEQNADTSEDMETQIRQACLTNEREEAILLDVLNICVKQSLTDVVEQAASKKAKNTKAQVQDRREEQESAAQQLAALIPRLLTRFGSIPGAASAVLRLEHVLNLDVFQALRQDSTTYSSLLADINRQFLSHNDSNVLNEAKTALLHAKSFEELEEITDGKLQALWDDTTLMLARLCKNEDLRIRGNLHVSVLNTLSSTILRIANLSSIAESTGPLDTPHTITSNSARRKSTHNPPVYPIKCLVDILGRGGLSPGLDDETDGAENLLINLTLKCILFYFMWQTSTLRSATASSITSASITALADRRTDVCDNLAAILSSRHGADPLRIQAAGTLLEITALFSTLKSNPAVSTAFYKLDLDLDGLCRFSTPIQRLVIKVFSAAERDYAQKAGKTLSASSADTQAGAATQAQDVASDSDSDDPTQDPTTADPVSSDEEGDDEDDMTPAAVDGTDDEPARRRKEARQQRKQRTLLLAEQALCTLTGKIVLALVGKVMESHGVKGKADDEVVRKRLKRNVGKLGANFRDVVGMLDAKPAGKGKGRNKGAVNGVAGGKGTPKAKAAISKAKSKERVEDDEDEDNGEEEDEYPVEEDGEQDLRNRELLVDLPSDREEEKPGGSAAAVEDEIESVLGD